MGKAAAKVIRQEWKDGAITNVHDDDDLWLLQHECKREYSEIHCHTLNAFLQAARQARSGSERTFVVLNLFSGHRREGDVQEHLERLALEQNIKILVISVDIGSDA